MQVMRESIRHLKNGGALLIFPRGSIEADPAFMPHPEAEFEHWSRSLEIFMQRAGVVESIDLRIGQEHHPTPGQILDLVHRLIDRDFTVGELLSQRLEVLGAAGDPMRNRFMLGERVPKNGQDGFNECEVALELLDRVSLDLILLAGRYTLLEQGAMDALLPRCASTGTGVVIGGPYNSGILAGQGAGAGVHYDYAAAPASVVERARAIDSVCQRNGVALGAAALQFVLAHPAVVSVVPGLASADEVADTLARYSAPIPAQLWAELKHLGLLRSDAPVESLEMRTT